MILIYFFYFVQEVSVSVTVSVTESILPILSCGERGGILQNILSSHYMEIWRDGLTVRWLINRLTHLHLNTMFSGSLCLQNITVWLMRFTNYTADWFDLPFSFLLHLVKETERLLNEFLLHAPFSSLMWTRLETFVRMSESIIRSNISPFTSSSCQYQPFSFLWQEMLTLKILLNHFNELMYSMKSDANKVHVWIQSIDRSFCTLSSANRLTAANNFLFSVMWNVKYRTNKAVFEIIYPFCFFPPVLVFTCCTQRNTTHQCLLSLIRTLFHLTESVLELQVVVSTRRWR